MNCQEKGRPTLYPKVRRRVGPEQVARNTLSTSVDETAARNGMQQFAGGVASRSTLTNCMAAASVAEIACHGAAFVQSRRLTTVQHRALRSVAACRTAALGGRLVACGSCEQHRLVYHSRRNRHCPTCQGAARASWLETGSVARDAAYRPYLARQRAWPFGVRLAAILRIDKAPARGPPPEIPQTVTTSVVDR